jgi:undecaprenyl-diphosphatase
MDEIHAPPQPGSPERAHRFLPLGSLSSFVVLGALFCIVATLGFVALSRAVFADQFVTIDDGLLLWLHQYTNPTLDQVMLLFTTLGESVVLTLLLLVASIGLLRFGRWIDVLGLIVAGAGAGIINQLLKVSYQRIRPDLFDGPFELTSYSFPSGHSMGSIVCYGMLAFVIVRLLTRPPYRVCIVVVAALLVIGVGLSRMYFGVHFPTDVIGGFIAGAIWLTFSIMIVHFGELYAKRRARSRGTRGPHPPVRA